MRIRVATLYSPDRRWDSRTGWRLPCFRTSPPLLACAILFSLHIAPHAATAQSSTQRQYQIKAACLLSFSKFTEWPGDEVKDATAHFVIGILGRDPFGPSFDRLIRGKQVRKRPITIKRFKAIEEIETCHLLFISSSEKGNLPDILEALKGTQTLTVGDDKRFVDQGCAIAFIVKRDTVKFAVNRESVKESGLKVSSRILKIAEEVIN